MNRLVPALACLVAWATAILESASRREGKDESAEPSPGGAAVTFSSALHRISVGSPVASVHSATAVELPDGTLRAYWFGGSREGAADVAIWSAETGGEGWGPPRLVVDRAAVSTAVRRQVRKLGNPVALARPDGRVTLFVVSVSLGGWSGSAVNRLDLDPGGTEIESAGRLVASPLLNLGTLVRGAAVESGGEILLPAYHETLRKFPLLLRLDRNGRVVGRGGPAVRGDLFQPWMLADANGPSDLFLRSGRGNEAAVHHSRREGTGWSDPVPLGVPNPNSGISALRLPGGDFLLAANPLDDSRERLVLLRAPAPQGPWRTVALLDTEAREPDEASEKRVEYSYPWLLRDRVGRVHVFYTWNRREIRHRVFGPGELEGREGGQ